MAQIGKLCGLQLNRNKFMAHFAKLNNENIVEQVIVADQAFIDSGAVGEPTEWLQTSYNTYGGVHKLGGEPFRKNYAGIGYTYDEKRDAFIPPQPFPSWTLNEETCLWDSPVPYPENSGLYEWNEEKVVWDKVNI